MDRRGFLKLAPACITGICAVFIPASLAKKEGLTVKQLMKCRDELKKAQANKDRQKFHTGDRVRIAAKMPTYMSHFPKDRDATILYSYYDKYGGENKEPNYALDLDGFGYCSWYNEYLLRRI